MVNVSRKGRGQIVNTSGKKVDRQKLFFRRVAELNHPALVSVVFTLTVKPATGGQRRS